MAPTVPDAMRAWQYRGVSGGLEKNLKLNPAVKPPVPKPNQHLVRIFTAYLNPVDYKVAEIPLAGRIMIPKPAVPGIDFAGRIVQPAQGSGLKEGQLVYGMGGSNFAAGGALADYNIAGDAAVAAVPAGVAPADAGALGTAAITAYQSIRPFVKSGQRVFINGGSGGCGAYGIQIAKALGCRVAVTCSGANAALVRGLGADDVIDYRTENALEALTRLAKDGPLFDHVVDNAGQNSALYLRAHDYTGEKAVYVSVGGDPSLQGLAGTLKMRLLPGFLGGGKRKIQGFFAQPKLADLEQLGAWMKEGKVKSVVDSRFAFEDAPRAFERLRTGRAKGKIAVDVAKEA